MGIGKPVILTRSAETGEIPEVAAVQVDPGLAEQEQLQIYMAWLALNLDARRAVGRHAAIHTAQWHGAAEVARALAQRLRAFDGQVAGTLR
jgi:hypothetical protein